MPKRTKLLPQQPLPVHQPHSLVSEGFTVKAMMKNSVVSDLPQLNALAPNQGTRGCRGWLTLGWIPSPGLQWVLFARTGNDQVSSPPCPSVCRQVGQVVRQLWGQVMYRFTSTFARACVHRYLKLHVSFLTRRGKKSLSLLQPKLVPLRKGPSRVRILRSHRLAIF